MKKIIRLYSVVAIVLIGTLIILNEERLLANGYTVDDLKMTLSSTEITEGDVLLLTIMDSNVNDSTVTIPIDNTIEYLDSEYQDASVSLDRINHQIVIDWSKPSKEHKTVTIMLKMTKARSYSLKALTVRENQEFSTSEENIEVIVSDGLRRESIEKKYNDDYGIKTGVWGSAPYEYKEESYELTVSGGELRNETSKEWLSRGINSALIKKIIFLDTVYLPSDSKYFFDCNPYSPTFKNLETIIGFDSLDTSNVTNMSGMFRKTKVIELDVSGFDTSQVIDMSAMFSDAEATELDISGFDTSKVTNMNAMFNGTKATELDVSGFDTSQVTNMAAMFSGTKATELDVSSFDTSQVINMNAMFSGTKAIELDVSGFDTSQVIDMSLMFASVKATELDISGFDTSKVTDMNAMFSYTETIKLDVSSFDTSKVTNMSAMFSYTETTELDVSGFDTSKVSDMRAMFANTKTTKLDISGFDTSKVTNMSAMFSEAKATELDVNGFDTSSVKFMNNMFNGTKLTELDVSGFDTSQVVNMTYMFASTNITDLNISGFDTSKVIRMVSMFYASEIYSISLGKDFLFDKSAGLSGPGRDSNILWQKKDLTSKAYRAIDFMEKYGSGDLTQGTYVAHTPVATVYLNLLSMVPELISTVGNNESLTVLLNVGSESYTGKAMATDVVLDLTKIVSNWELNETLGARYRAPNSSNMVESTVTVDSETKKIKLPDLPEGSLFEITLKGKTWNNTTQGKTSENITKVGVDYTTVIYGEKGIKDSHSEQINHEINNGGLFFDKLPKKLSFKQTAFSASMGKKFIDRQSSDWSIEILDLRGTNPISVDNPSASRQNWEVTALVQPFEDDEGVIISTSTLELFFIEGDHQTPLNAENEVVVFSRNVDGETPKENIKRTISWDDDQGLKLKAHNKNGLHTNKTYQAQIDFDLRLAP